MLIKRTSDLTGNTHEVDLPVTNEQLERWLNGELVQNVFWHLTAAQREFLMTGITPEEWDDMVSGVYEDEDDYNEAEGDF